MADFAIGEVVETHGLTSQQYNGLHGVVERYVGNKGRYMVRLHGSPSDEKPLGLKPVNLRKLSQSAAVGPAAAIYTEPLLRLCVELAVADFCWDLRKIGKPLKKYCELRVSN